MASKTSLGEIRPSTQNPADPVGYTIDHYISTIVGYSVTKLSNIEPQGRMLAKFKSINSFYSNAKRNKDQVSFDEGLTKASMSPKQNGRDLRSNNLTDSREPELSTDEIGLNSDEIIGVPGTDDMTLKELHLRCKAKKQKIKRELLKSATSSLCSEESKNEGYSKVQVKEEPDLSEPLINFKRKHLKRCMHKGEMAKARKVGLSVSPSCSSGMVENRKVQCIPRVKEEITESDDGETSDGKKHSVGAFSSPQSTKFEPERVSLYSRRNALFNDVNDKLSEPDFQDVQDATDLVAGVSDNFVTKFQFPGDQPIGTLPQVSRYSRNDVLISVEKQSAEMNRDSSHLVIEPENGSSHEYGKNSISGDGSRTDALPSNQQHEMEFACILNEESHIPMDLSAETFADNRSIQLQSSETNCFVKNIISNHTSKVSPHFSISEGIQNDLGQTSGVTILETTNYLSASPVLESYAGSTQLQCPRDDYRMTCPLAMTGRIVLPPSTREFDVDSRHIGRLAQTPTSEGSGCLYPNVPACGSYSESTDQDGGKHDDLKITYVSNACDLHIDSANHEKMVMEDMQNGSVDEIAYDHQFEDDLDGVCISAGDKESNGIAKNVPKEMTPGTWENDSPSSEVSASAINTSSVNGVSPSIGSEMLHTINNPDTETGDTYEEVVTSSFNNEVFREIDENECRSCQTSHACSSTTNGLLPTTNDYQETTVSHTILDGDNFGASINYKDLQAQEQRETFNFCKDTKPMQPPRRLPSNRKIFCLPSKEKLFQALDAEEFYESMRYYRNRRKLSLDKWLDSPSLSDSKLSPEKTIAKPRNTCCVTKGILKTGNNSSAGGCNMQESSPPSSHSQGAIKFSQRQMRDIDSITEKLLTAVKSMKSIMEETLNLEEFSSTHLKSTTEKMMTAIEDAAAVEVTTQKYMSMMNRDFKRFCKIMRSRESDTADKMNNAPKKRRKITFADETGGLLCHIKVFEEPSALAVIGGSSGGTDSNQESDRTNMC